MLCPRFKFIQLTGVSIMSKSSDKKIADYFCKILLDTKESQDYHDEIISWAYHKLTAFGVGKNSQKDAIMMDRLRSLF